MNRTNSTTIKDRIEKNDKIITADIKHFLSSKMARDNIHYRDIFHILRLWLGENSKIRLFHRIQSNMPKNWHFRSDRFNVPALTGIFLVVLAITNHRNQGFGRAAVVQTSDFARQCALSLSQTLTRQGLV